MSVRILLIPVVKTDSRVDKYDDDDRPRRENYVRHALELLIMHLLLDGVDIFGRRWIADLRVLNLHFRLCWPILFCFFE